METPKPTDPTPAPPAAPPAPPEVKPDPPGIPACDQERSKRSPAALPRPKPAVVPAWVQTGLAVPIPADPNIDPNNLDITITIQIRGQEFKIYDQKTRYTIQMALTPIQAHTGADTAYRHMTDAIKVATMAYRNFSEVFHKKPKQEAKPGNVEYLPPGESMPSTKLIAAQVENTELTPPFDTSEEVPPMPSDDDQPEEVSDRPDLPPPPPPKPNI
jgi:hypothetical protein